ncbi:tail protein [Variovorax phage VAC_51]|uniref:Tail protein n=1 Tax=Variovorax phage VAC_51 TaxID=2985242 RepID=A0A9N6ZHV3_9CAUD|nr:tail protein [Variovorax phage VAC_51]
MAAFEGSQKNMLQGVSQQLQRERLEGQVSSQMNMLSDVVTGVRRRPGAEVQTIRNDITNAMPKQIVAWDGDLAGQRIKVLLNGVDGVLRIFDPEWNELSSFTNSYFQFANRTDIQHTITADKMYVLNRSKVPFVATRSSSTNNTRKGFFFIKSGTFATRYAVTVSDSGAAFTAEYTTPEANIAGAAAQSTPEYINARLAEQVAGAFGGSWGVAASGSYTYVMTASPGCRVTTNNSASFVGVSNQQYVQQISDLPSRLPSAGDGLVIAVGSVATPTYYRFNFGTGVWQEGPKEGSATSLGNMPPYVFVNSGGAWALGSDYEGRLAGDDNTNPDPSFLNYGIDGIGSFQGRLVLLNGSKVNMSASNKPQRFWRSTIETVLVSDPIEVGASANSSAAYQYCVPFNKDLLLFSEKYQALVPGGGSILGPANATVVVTSTYESDMSSAPLPLGRTVMFPAPRSKDFFGLMEMLPSPYTDSQYVSSDVTAHLPKYLNGRCRFSVSSSVSGIGLFASSTDLRTLVVHEYTWDGDEKAQQAWHKWTFPYDIADAFFAGSEINLIFVNNGHLLVATIDPRIGTLTADAERRPFLDIYAPASVVKTDSDPTVGGTVTISANLVGFDPLWYSKARLADRAIELLGEEVGIDQRIAPNTLVTVPSFGEGEVTMGIPYRSSISPSMPMVKDSNGVVISANKLTLLRFMIGTANSSEYEAIVSDSGDDSGDTQEDMATLYWGSADLDLGDPRISTESTAILPCRTNAATTTVILFTESLGELNLISLEYVCRYNQKLKRR